MAASKDHNMATAKNPSAAPKKMGRPSIYTPALAAKICDLIEQGHSERQISQMPGMPSTVTLGKWKDENPDFLSRSVRARAISAQLYDDRRRETANWLIEEAKKRADAGFDFPKGVVDAMKAAMQEDARSAAMRDDRNFADRKRTEITGKDGGPIELKTVETLSNEELLEIARMSTTDEKADK